VPPRRGNAAVISPLSPAPLARDRERNGDARRRQRQSGPGRGEDAIGHAVQYLWRYLCSDMTSGGGGACVVVSRTSGSVQTVLVYLHRSADSTMSQAGPVDLATCHPGAFFAAMRSQV
jgi:hypothetical protein